MGRSNNVSQEIESLRSDREALRKELADRLVKVNKNARRYRRLKHCYASHFIAVRVFSSNIGWRQCCWVERQLLGQSQRQPLERPQASCRKAGEMYVA